MLIINLKQCHKHLSFTLSIISLLLSGCKSANNESSNLGSQDKEIVSKRIVGVWKTRLVGERDGKLVTLMNVYYIFRKPDSNGEGIRLFAYEKNDTLRVWDEITNYRISETFDDGKLIKINRIVSGEVIGSDTFEIIQEPDFSAVLTTDKRKRNKDASEIIGKPIDKPDFEKREYQRIIDPIELDRIEEIIKREFAE